jgi:hypothetical protein
VPLGPPDISHGPARGQTGASAVRVRRSKLYTVSSYRTENTASGINISVGDRRTDLRLPFV